MCVCAKAATKIYLLSFYICYLFCLKLDARIFFLIICRINFAVATNKKLFFSFFSKSFPIFAGSECLIKLVKLLILLRFDQRFKSQHSTIFEFVCVYDKILSFLDYKAPQAFSFSVAQSFYNGFFSVSTILAHPLKIWICSAIQFCSFKIGSRFFCKSVNKMAKFSEIEHSCCVFVCHYYE